MAGEREGQGVTFDGDRPKQALAEDRLGHASFARALADAIARAPTQDGIVVAVHGAWGSGKSSAVNMAIELLQAPSVGEAGIIVTRFNPWMFSGQDDLTRAFFSELSATLGSRMSSRVSKAFRSLARRASGMRKVVGSGFGFVPGGGTLKSLVEDGLEALGVWARDDESLHARRDELISALKFEGRRILVVMDDVDRLPPDEVIQVFRLVKSVADLPNVVHLLVFDREVARVVINARAVSGLEGTEWLDKIVQLSFDLPPAHRTDLHAMLFERLDRAASAISDMDLGRWPDVFHRGVAPWLRTPRDVIRLANGVAAGWPLVRDKVDFADFVALQTLRLFESRVYDVVRAAASELTGLGRGDEDQGSLAARLLEAGTPSRRDDVRAALSLLFPRLEQTWDNHGYAGDFMQVWDRARRICSARRFTTYFTFALDEGLLTEEERSAVVASLTDPGSFADIVALLRERKRRAGGTRADLLLDELTNDDGLIPEGLEVEATRALLEAGDVFTAGLDERDASRVPTSWAVAWALEALLGRVTREGRTALVGAAMAASPSLGTLSGMLRTLRRQHGRDGSDARPSDERLVDDDGLDAIESRYRERMVAEARGGGPLPERTSLASTLYVWRDVGGAEAVRDWTSRQIQTDVGALSLARSLTGSGTSSALGSHAVTEFPHVERASVATILDLDALVERLRVLRAGADASQASIVDRFLRGLASER